MQLPAEFDLDQAKSVFEGLRTMTTVAERLKAFCMECVGLPYAENPLTGDSQTSEELTCSLASYDCVTLVETALSFALALTPQEAISILTQIRYSEGHIAWTARNHYMHNWITNGERHARVSRVRFRGSEKIKECTLSCIKELLAEQISFPYLPIDKIEDAKSKLCDGDIVLFVSEREDLDVFHVGFLFWEGETLMLCHAARSQESVVYQDFDEFVSAQSMPGIVLVRPNDAGDRE